MSKKKFTVAASLTMVGVMGLGVIGSTSSVYAHDDYQQQSRYTVELESLNDSDVYGWGNLKLNGDELKVRIRASGLEPNMPHVAHIHGKLEGSDAMCPDASADVNNDGFVSVFEGAPAYGPIKLNLTDPQTPFGPSPSPVLFAPFAGTPNTADFPQVGDDGIFNLSTTYTFNLDNAADAQAFNSLHELDKQHVVIHGAYAPQNVDTAGGSSQVVYDPLLPVACGEIVQADNQEGDYQSNRDSDHGYDHEGNHESDHESDHEGHHSEDKWHKHQEEAEY